MNFTLDVKKWVSEEAEDVIEGTIRAIALELFGSVILDTPVDTGRLRGNWRISRNKPKDGTVQITDPSGDTAIKKVEDVVFGSDIMRSDIQFFLTNNLPYVAAIEYDGHSRQSPDGMVRKNAIRISNNLQARYG